MLLCSGCAESLGTAFETEEILGTLKSGKCDFCRKTRACARFRVGDKKTAGDANTDGRD